MLDYLNVASCVNDSMLFFVVSICISLFMLNITCGVEFPLSVVLHCDDHVFPHVNIT